MQDYLIILKSGKIFSIIAYSLMEAVSSAQEFETGIFGDLFDCSIAQTAVFVPYSKN